MLPGEAISLPTPADDSKAHYQLSGDDQPIPSRAVAVARAKERSRQTNRPIKLERADNKVQMVFREGSLLEYSYTGIGTGRR